MYVLLVTADPDPPSVLPALSLLGHAVRSVPVEGASLLQHATADVTIVDARSDLAAARRLCRLLSTVDTSIPLIALVDEGGLVALTTDWGLDDILLPGTGPTEVDARLRLLARRRHPFVDSVSDGKISFGELVIDTNTYTALVRGRTIELTFKEFELLKHLVEHAGQVFTRHQLLREVWGYDFFGGSRTIDVHVRRLRAKLGTEYESLIGTVRNVGYKAVRPPRAPSSGTGDAVRVRRVSGRFSDPAAAIGASITAACTPRTAT
ncbi:MAG: response regulator with CheY-like receiver domain and winged-helix DNA-binding domain [Mycobacterium sp.]|jgi:DNA-binding response OmpR family regulator|nr:response regulator with CheY-like receiver domain and winged-helix DNA-binding domain [Mycobacterium sp.]